MQISQNILDKGLLSELAYLKLEDAYWKTPNDEGRIPNYQNNDDLEKFLTGINPKTDKLYTSGINDNRKEAILDFLNTHTIEDFTTTPSGMQAMTIIKNDGSETTVAFRGTETSDWSEVLKDVGSDGQMALGTEIQQMKDALTYFQTVETEHKDLSPITITGHSLGGALAQYVAYKSTTAYETYTFNGFGIKKNEGVINSSGDTSHIHNFHLGVDFVSGLGSKLGGASGGDVFQAVHDVLGYIPTSWLTKLEKIIVDAGALASAATINYEIDKLIGSFLGEVTNIIPYDSSSITDNLTDHMMAELNQSLELYLDLADLFGSNEIESINADIASLASVPYEHLESSPYKIISSNGLPKTLELLGYALLQKPLSDGSRYDDLTNTNELISQLKQASSQNGGITVFSHGYKTSEELYSAVQNSKAILYTVVNTLPPVIFNNENASIYSQFDSSFLSDEQLQDRAKMYYFMEHPRSKIEGIGTLYTNQETQTTVFDKEAAINKVVFGSNKNETETLYGLGGDDRLYGNKGDDTIDAGEGDDYLEGGAGNDTLKGGLGYDTYISADGDTIEDSDHQGKIIFETEALKAGTYNETKNVYEAYNGEYTLNNNTLTFTNKNGKILTINNFSKQYQSLGINLVDGKVVAEITDTTFKEGDTTVQHGIVTITLTKPREKDIVIETSLGDVEIKKGETQGELEIEWNGNKNENENQEFVIKIETIKEKQEDGTLVENKEDYNTEAIGKVTITDDDTNEELSEKEKEGNKPDYNPFKSQMADPLVLDMNKDGKISTVSLDESETYFDLTGDGIKERTSWVKSEDAFLVYDKNEDGKIADINEVFGNASKSGFDELRDTVDSNYDNKIDRRDVLYNRLQLWHDHDQDGKVDNGELTYLKDAGVESINLNSIGTSIEIDGAILTDASKYTDSQGNKELIADLELKYQPKVSINHQNKPYDLDPTSLVLPSLRGYGKVANSFYTYNTNEAMKNMAKEYAGDINLVANHFDDFIATWAGFYTMAEGRGIGKEQFTPGFLDVTAIKIWVLEQFSGNIVNAWRTEAHLKENTNGGYHNTSYSNQSYIDNKYNELIGRYEGIFALQSVYRDKVQGISYNLNKDEFEILDDELFKGSVIDYMNDSNTGLDYKIYLGKTLNNLQGVFLDFQGADIITAIENEDLKETITNIFDSQSNTEIYLFDSKNINANNDITVLANDDNNTINITSNNSNSTIISKKGDDKIITLNSNDTYVFKKGDGTDTIYDTNGTDKISFGENISKDDVTLSTIGTNLVISITNSDDKITIVDFIKKDNRIETIEFKNGDEINLADNSIISMFITQQNDIIELNDENNTINSLGGDDIVRSFGGDDTINAGDGNDIIESGNGNDTLKGEAGNDILNAGSGDDTLEGGTGNDTLKGGTGNDTYLYAKGDGADTISDTSGNDTLSFASGITKADLTAEVQGNDLIIAIKEEGVDFNSLNDTITIKNYLTSGKIENIKLNNGETISLDELQPTTEGDDYLTYGNSSVHVDSLGGDDTIITGNGNNTINTGTGDDVIISKNGNDIITAADGNDNINAGNGANTIDAGSGNDTIVSGSGADSIVAGEGNDTINAGAGNDTLKANEGDDTLSAGSGNDTLEGGTGADLLQGGLGNDTYVFNRGDGQDIVDDSYRYGYGGQLSKNAGNDTLKFGNGIVAEDLIVRVSGNDIIISLKEDGVDYSELTDKITLKNYLDSNSRIENIKLSDGQSINLNELLSATEGDDQLIYSDTSVSVDALGGDDRVVSGNGADNISGGSGNDHISSGAGDDKLFGGDDDDTLEGGSGNDTLSGGSGHDRLYGGSGNDVLEGGVGNDTLEGGLGNDTYKFKRGSGTDTIYDNYTQGNAGTDTLIFGENISKDDLIVRVQGSDLVIGLHVDGVEFENLEDKITIKQYFNSNNRIETLKLNDGTIVPLDQLQRGTEGHDTLVYDDNDNTVNALGGNDRVTTGSGDDIVDGGSGNDTINTKAGNDIVFGGEGDDTVFSGSGDDTVEGGSGDDTIYANSGDNILKGGTGTDMLYGGAGHDVYMYAKGDGNDTINDESGNDRIIFSEGIVKENLIAQARGNDLIIAIKEDGVDFNSLNDKITIKNYLTSGKIEKLELNDGSALSLDDLQKGTQNDDYLAFGNEDTTIDGLGGNDTIITGSGSDTINAGSGNDTVNSGSGIDNIIGGEGDDVINSGGGDDTLSGDEGNDILSGGTGEDTLSGGTGDDSLYGGNDNDTINGDAGDDTLWGNYGNDTLKGGEGNDTLYGDYNYTSRNYTVGNDTLEGGEGNDTLDGGGGDDIYVFNRGDGQDYIYDKYQNRYANWTGGGNDTLKFGDGITQDDLILKQNGNQLIVALKEDGKTFDELSDKITLENFSYNTTQYKETQGNYNAFFGIEKIEFSDGTSWDEATMIANIGTDENDIIFGQDGNDTIEGGKGDDTLYGRLGDDTYIFNRGDGKDTIFDDYGTSQGNSNSGNDTLKFGEGISADDLVFWMDGANLKVDAGNGDIVTINSQTNLNNAIEKIELANGQYVTNIDLEKLKEDLSLYASENSITINSTEDIRANAQMMEIIKDVWRDSGDVGGEFTAPIVLDTNSNGVTSTDIQNSNVYFDYNGDGVKEKTAWAQSGDALLAMDLNGDGIINNGSELFGNFTKLSDGSTAPDGYAALAQYDTNGDNIIDSKDSAFSSLKLWKDVNSDGITQSGELSSLQLSSITAIYLYREDGTSFEQMTEAGNIITNQTNFTTDNGTGIVRDVWFKTDATDTITNNETYISTDADESFSGGEGNDTYIAKLGGGKDIIDDNDLSGLGADTLRFASSINSEQVLVKWDMQSNGLLIGIRENSDDDTALKDLDNQILIKNWFDGKGKIEEFSFADGTTLNAEDIYNKLVSVKENGELTTRVLNDGDTLIGERYNDVLFGAQGNELIEGNDGDDYLNGKAGDDKLIGGSDDDTLEGGKGVDILMGGSGDDYYIFGRGDGKDTILDSSGSDTIMFGSNIVRQDILAKIVGDDITFGIKEEGKSFEELSDTITIRNYAQTGFEIEKVLFDDGSTYSVEDLLNQAPILISDVENIEMQDVRTLTQSFKVTDPDGDELTYTLKDAPTNGNLTLNSDGTWSYAATGTYTGLDSVIVEISDGNGGVVNQTLNFDLKVSAPSLDNVQTTLDEDTDTSNTLHVNNPVGGILTYEIVDNVDNGNFNLNANGSYMYTPNENYNGNDNIVVKVTNEYGLSTTATLDLTITPVNDAPELAVDTVALTLQDIRTTDGQVEASDVDGDELTYTLKTAPTNGTLVLNANGTWSYAATGTYTGLDSAIVEISDGNGGVVNQTLNFDLKVSAPSLDNMQATLNEDTASSNTLQVNNPIGGTLIYEIVGNADNGIFNINTDGSYMYTPNANYNGSDTLNIKVTNEYGLSATATLDLTITPVNDAPEFIDPSDESHILKNSRIVTGSLEATDIDGDTLNYAVTTNPTHGTINIDENGNWSYESEFGYVGNDHVTLSVDDGNGEVITKEYHFNSKGLVYEGGDITIGEQDIGDTLELGTINMDSLSFSKDNNNLTIEVQDQGTITLSNYFTTPNQTLTTIKTSWGEINIDKEVIKEASGHWWSWSKSAYANNGEDTLLVGTNRSDRLYGADGNDVLVGDSRNDSLYGRGGKDTLFGGSGNDRLYGNDGNDTLFGGSGRDRLYAGRGDDFLIGGSGNDTLYGNDGNDTLSGGTGYDWLRGGTGDDTYYVNSGDGTDYISDSRFDFWSFGYSEGGNDTLKFGEDVQKEDISFIMKHSKLSIKYGDSDTVNIYGQSNDARAIEKLELSDGSFMQADDIDRIIQEMSAYAVDNGIDISSQDNIRNNEALMQIVTSGWQSV